AADSLPASRIRSITSALCTWLPRYGFGALRSTYSGRRIDAGTGRRGVTVAGRTGLTPPSYGPTHPPYERGRPTVAHSAEREDHRQHEHHERRPAAVHGQVAGLPPFQVGERAPTTGEADAAPERSHQVDQQHQVEPEGRDLVGGHAG